MHATHRLKESYDRPISVILSIEPNVTVLNGQTLLLFGLYNRSKIQMININFSSENKLIFV